MNEPATPAPPEEAPPPAEKFVGWSEERAEDRMSTGVSVRGTGPVVGSGLDGLKSTRRVAVRGAEPLAIAGNESVIVVPPLSVVEILVIVVPVGTMPGPETVSPTFGVSNGFKKTVSSEVITFDPNVRLPVKGLLSFATITVPVGMPGPETGSPTNGGGVAVLMTVPLMPLTS